MGEVATAVEVTALISSSVAAGNWLLAGLTIMMFQA